MKASTITILVVFLIGGSCKEMDPVELIFNGGGELGFGFPSAWDYHDGWGAYKVTWENQPCHSGSRSFHISTNVQSPDSSFWAQQRCRDIPRGKALTLKAMVKGNLVGPGIRLAIRCDDASSSLISPGVQFISTEGSSSITGTFDWTEYSVQIAEVSPAATCTWIFLVYLPNTTGEVYFDDVSLVHY